LELGLVGKSALICGSSSGIGLAVVKGLASEGANIIMCSRDQERIAKAARSISDLFPSSKIIPVCADLSKPEDIHRLVKVADNAFNSIDILFNNTGGPPASRFLEVDDEMWLVYFESLFMSVVRLCRACYPLMTEKGGVVVNLLSRSAKESLPDLVISNSFRAALAALAKTLSVEFAPNGIRVNNVIPGMIRTQRQEYLIKRKANDLKISESVLATKMTDEIPLKRMGEADEVAAMVVFLCSQQASYITGSSFFVDGGTIKSNV
jgi:3-oxoacyl-[acyl-carrier protein] reductase